MWTEDDDNTMEFRLGSESATSVACTSGSLQIKMLGEQELQMSAQELASIEIPIGTVIDCGTQRPKVPHPTGV